MYMTGFADEAAKGIDGQIKATLELGWRNIESRAVDGVNIHDLDDTAFDIVYGLTGGGPAQSTQMLALWAFTQSMQIFDFGRGSAISVVLLGVTLAIVIPYMRWTQKREEASE